MNKNKKLTTIFRKNKYNKFNRTNTVNFIMCEKDSFSKLIKNPAEIQLIASTNFINLQGLEIELVNKRLKIMNCKKYIWVLISKDENLIKFKTGKVDNDFGIDFKIHSTDGNSFLNNDILIYILQGKVDGQTNFMFKGTSL